MTSHECAGMAAKSLLRGGFGGEIRLAGDEGYDVARMPWNRRIDPHPAVVADATGPEDVRLAVLAARDHDLALAVQSTGHGAVVPSDGGFLLRTATMAAVQVDPVRRTATVGPGALWTDVVEAAAPYSLAPLSGTASVGVTGFTLGGGTGWLSRKHGFSADSVVRADVVTSDGELRTATAEENPDLFWALRGGSGNFGIVTALTFRLYPVTAVYAGMSFYAADRAFDTFARYRDWAAGEPDELNTAVMLVQMPSAPTVPEPLRGRRVLGVRAFWTGPAAGATTQLESLLAAAGPALVDGFRVTSFANASAMLGQPHPQMAVRQHIDLFDDLSDSLLSTLVDVAGEGADSPLASIELRHWGGAMARPDENAGPTGHRDVPFSVIAAAPIADPADRADVEACVDGLAEKLAPHATGGSFLNFLTDPTRTRTAYTEANWSRLVREKKAWDPDNVFRLNHNISPS